MRTLTILAVLALVAGSAASQTAAPAATAPGTETAVPAPAAATTPAADAKYLLKEGTPVSLKFAQSLSSKTANEDDPVQFLLDEDIKAGDVIVAKKGSQAVGTVSHAKKAGMMGKAGELNIRLEYIKTNGNRIRIRGTQGREGDSKVGTAVALTVLFGPIGLIKHGKNVEVKEGTALKAYVDQDMMLLAEK